MCMIAEVATIAGLGYALSVNLVQGMGMGKSLISMVIWEYVTMDSDDLERRFRTTALKLFQTLSYGQAMMAGTAPLLFSSVVGSQRRKKQWIIREETIIHVIHIRSCIHPDK